MKSFLASIHGKNVILICVLCALFAVVGLSEYRYERLSAHVHTLESSLNDTTGNLTGRITTINDQLSKTTDMTNIISDALLTEQRRTGAVAEQVGNVTNTVGALEKLAKTDPELLKKYSKVYFLNEHYIPASLVLIDKSYLYNPANTQQFHGSAYAHLSGLIDAAIAEHVTLKVLSAYRSFGTQSTLKKSYQLTYGAGTANQFSADQGYSEHQLGTALDFTTPAIGDTFSNFDASPEYAWLSNNAYKYGFVISYPKGNAYYEFEPWHWRYVGVALATELHNTNKYFYDMDQRAIDAYLSRIFD